MNSETPPDNKRRRITLQEKVDALLLKVRCESCGKLFVAGDEIEWDHYIPLGAGGTNSPDNMYPRHAECHAVKTKKDVAAMAKVKRLRKREDEHQEKMQRPLGEPRPKSGKWRY